MKDYRQRKMRLMATAVDFLGAVFFPAKRDDLVGIKKILFLKFDRLGDTFISLPTISSFRQGFPQAKLIVLAAPWNREVLENNPDIDELKIISGLPDVWFAGIRDFLNPKTICFLRDRIKEVKPDLAVDLQGSALNVLAMYKAKVRYRLGFGPKIFSFLLNYRSRYNKLWPQGLIYLSLAKALGLPLISSGRLYPSEEEKLRVDSFISNQGRAKLVVFHLGAGKSYRLWPIANFVELAKLVLDSHYDLKIVVFGFGAEKERVQKFIHLLGPHYHLRILDISGRFNFREFDYLLSSVHSFIGNDSAPAWLAGASGIPTVAVYNAWSVIKRFGVVGDRVRLVYRQAHRCQGQFCLDYPCPNMTAVSAAEVFSIWEKLII